MESFLASQPGVRREEMRTLHDLIRQHAPQLQPKMWGPSIIGYGQYRYRYQTGREGEHFIVGLSPRKSFLSLYITTVDADGYLAERNQARLGKVKVGRSCINLRKLADLNLDVAAELIRRAATTRNLHAAEPGGRSGEEQAV